MRTIVHKHILGVVLSAGWLVFTAPAAFSQCYPGLACPTDQNQQQPGTSGGGTSGGNAGASSGAGRAGTGGVEYHFVGPVSPPDDWLSLRTVPSDKAGSRIVKMPEGTLFKVTEKRGDWWFLQLRDGKSGWAHSYWIRCCKYLNE